MSTRKRVNRHEVIVTTGGNVRDSQYYRGVDPVARVLRIRTARAVEVEIPSTAVLIRGHGRVLWNSKTGALYAQNSGVAIPFDVVQDFTRGAG